MGKTNNRKNTGRRVHGRKLNRDKNRENRVRRERQHNTGGLSDPRKDKVRKDFLKNRADASQFRAEVERVKGPCCPTQEALVTRDTLMHKELVSSRSRAYNTVTGAHDILVIDAWFRRKHGRHMAHFRLYLRENNIRTVG
ncbi:MAG TPA: hypothetical protein QGI72_02925 [Poseidonia sp.]|nr:hypothetical protein [Poseidonia sp.]